MKPRQESSASLKMDHSVSQEPRGSSILNLVRPEQAKVKIALAGNPNSGKSTLFNALTGARQQVGNYPGVTVEKKEGVCQHEEDKIHIVDLPGTYSLTANSLEEMVARNFLVQEKPGVVVDIVDASNLKRHLYLTCQLLEMGIPVVLALNMIDVARDRGVEVNADRLSELMGIPVVPVIARTGEGKQDLVRQILETAKNGNKWQSRSISYGDDIDNALLIMTEKIEAVGFMTGAYPPRWVALKYVENDRQIVEQGREIDTSLSDELEKMAAKLSRHLRETEDVCPEAIIVDHRYGYIRSLLRQEVISQRYEADRLFLSDKIDKVLTNRLFGPLIMLAILFGLYQFTFTYSEQPVAWLESFFGFLGIMAENHLPDGLLKSLVISGIIDGVGGVLGFVPLIMFMFFGIAVLEDTGYLARVAFMLDRVFRIFGLHGNSVMGYIVSGGIAGGCAVPGVMATRTLKSSKERMATLLTVPFMNCGAKLPVLALLIGTFFATQKAWFMFSLTLLAWFVSLLVAKLLRSTILKGEATPFVMELPPYRLPTLKGLAIHTWERTWQYIKKAGTVILGISILLWALMTFPGLPESEKARFAAEREAIITGYSSQAVAEYQNGEGGLSPEAQNLKSEISALEGMQAQEVLRNSIAGRIGTALADITWLAGFDWRTNIALVGGFAAKEVVVSTLGTAYSLGEVDPEGGQSLSNRLAASPNWNPVKAFALMIFVMFYAPCFVTVVCMVKECGSWKWGLFSMGFNTVFAFALAVAVYQIGTLIVPG